MSFSESHYRITFTPLGLTFRFPDLVFGSEIVKTEYLCIRLVRLFNIFLPASAGARVDKILQVVYLTNLQHSLLCIRLYVFTKKESLISRYGENKSKPQSNLLHALIIPSQSWLSNLPFVISQND